MSYGWGPDDELHRIKVNGNALYVTPNLRTALPYLRYGEKPRRLWIDKICIDQARPRERAAQVSIIREIYAAAHTTIAWLGDTSKDVKKVLSRNWASSEWHASDDSDDVLHERRHLSIVVGRSVRKTRMLADFTIAWILQETAVSRNVRLQSGHTTCALSDFLNGVGLSSNVPGSTLSFGHMESQDSWYERAECFILLSSFDFEDFSLSLSYCFPYFGRF